MENSHIAFILCMCLVLGALTIVYHYFTVKISAFFFGAPMYRIRVGFTHYVFKDAAIYRVDDLLIAENLQKVRGALSRKLISLIIKDFRNMKGEERRKKIYLRTIFLSDFEVND